MNNALLLETKKFYPKEFDVGLKALDMVNEVTGVMMPEDEAGFIFINAYIHTK